MSHASIAVPASPRRTTAAISSSGGSSPSALAANLKSAVRKSRGGGHWSADDGPSPSPRSPWHAAQ